MENSLFCASPTRWAFTPRVWTGVSTIRMAGGRSVVSGRPMAHERRSMPRAARAQRARLSIFNCAPIRWRDNSRSNLRAVEDIDEGLPEDGGVHSQHGADHMTGI